LLVEADLRAYWWPPKGRPVLVSYRGRIEDPERPAVLIGEPATVVAIEDVLLPHPVPLAHLSMRHGNA
jgi:hypothetical protein